MNLVLFKSKEFHCYNILKQRKRDGKKKSFSKYSNTENIVKLELFPCINFVFIAISKE